MKALLPLDEMTTAEKLSAMESLWEDLCRSPENVPSQPWHEDTLVERERRVREGGAGFSDLREVKDRVRKTTR